MARGSDADAGRGVKLHRHAPSALPRVAPLTIACRSITTKPQAQPYMALTSDIRPQI